MAEPLWTSDEILAATGGTLVCTPFEATGVSIDTRTLEPGDLFVALAGARDGHEFVGAARAHGSAAALVSHPVTGCQVVVPDTLKALEALGAAARERASTARRGAVTGSVGKTSVTQALAAGLALAGPSHASIKSYNNHIGVPLTLARMPRETQRAVFEVGMNHADEITPLSRMIRPHAVAITTVGPVHMENFADGEQGVARAKAEIFAGLEPGGVAVLNADNRWFDLLAGEARAAGAKVMRFGAADGAEAQLTGFEMTAGGAVVEAVLHGRPLRFPIRQSGAHWGPNSLAVLLMLEALDVGLETGLAALAEFAPLGGRGAERRLVVRGGDVQLIDESYNANPVSMAAAIASLGAHPAAGRRIAVLTDMLELGPDSPRFHAELAGPLAEARADRVFCAGPLMRALWEALPAARRGAWAETAHDLIAEVAAAIGPGDVIMVKGSNGSKAGEIVSALSAMFQEESAGEGAAH
ncbi:UDP-N-acetylmuramoyl-tripeptide--D-alanyl-D-alanine ligase [Phenylobacterium montanum]|uniref:UDP-N-acetylmuramoyl-tripeptide--D-alanyl-D-alanine ligase n=1 Tax=Phenylobacterium montanum TaxID=2823693 RepID=A0A975FZI9_9CAUL|nr:UDP-N-acetylmuramoyl-tripeptide--D-alanyl-D-alanine ligase [Caulobacter sp. S6]QUD87743.1 UDP-N-acetylmuramoyl-tripeptide--D-alanyl-D-alanine ligase [Caulobacter sp. S6]